MVPFGLVPKLFVFDDEELKPEFRAQRKLNRARVPEITRYVLDHPGEYVFLGADGVHRRSRRF